MRGVIGDVAKLAVDYNQSLSVTGALERVRVLDDEGGRHQAALVEVAQHRCPHGGVEPQAVVVNRAAGVGHLGHEQQGRHPAPL